MKSGFFTSEFAISIASIAAAVLPVIAGRFDEHSAAGLILGALATAAAYVAGRSYVKAAGLRAQGLDAIAQAAKDA